MLLLNFYFFLAAMAQHEAKEETGKDGEEAADLLNIIITAIILK